LEGRKLAEKVLDIKAITARYDREKAEQEALERALRPFNPEGRAYDREMVILEAQFFLYHHAKCGYEFGKRLILLKEHESAPLVAQIVEERLRIPLRTAQRYEQHARLCVRSEKFRAIFDRPGMQSKGVALLAGLTDPEMQAELDRFDETGQLLGLEEAEIQAKTKKELVRENKRLRALRDQKIKDLEAEKARLSGRVEALEAERLTPGLEKGQKLLNAGERQMNEAIKSLAQADFGLLAADAGSVALCRHLIDKLRRAADELEKQMFGGRAI
jgi:hypothetical protein